MFLTERVPIVLICLTVSATSVQGLLGRMGSMAWHEAGGGEGEVRAGGLLVQVPFAVSECCLKLAASVQILFQK